MTRGATPPRPTLAVLMEDRRGRKLRVNPFSMVKYVALLRAGGFHFPSANTVGLCPRALARYRRRGEAILRRGVIPAWHRRWPRLAPGDDPVGHPDVCLASLVRILACIHDPSGDPELFLAAFAWACLEAEGEGESTLVAGLRKAASERPEIALKLLERRYPERWAPKPAVAAKVEATSAGTTAALVIYAPPEVEP